MPSDPVAKVMVSIWLASSDGRATRCDTPVEQHRVQHLYPEGPIILNLDELLAVLVADSLPVIAAEGGIEVLVVYRLPDRDEDGEALGGGRAGSR